MIPTHLPNDGNLLPPLKNKKKKKKHQKENNNKKQKNKKQKQKKKTKNKKNKQQQEISNTLFKVKSIYFIFLYTVLSKHGYSDSYF